MLVTIIGSGNVATVMGKVLAEKGHVIAEVYSRDPSHATATCEAIKANAVNDLKMLEQEL
jgi:predicted dinucleotide-binding enzyme